MITVIFLFPAGNFTVYDLLMSTVSILCFATPVTLILAMPIAYFAWRQLQHYKITLSHLQATLIGFVTGAGLYTLFLISFSGLSSLYDMILFSSLIGGGYGLLFSLLFSLSGGLATINDHKP
ncbi:MAG: hypothetical protein ACI9SQ_001256 [Rubritalea sp.]|jgi:hypothetical protein